MLDRSRQELADATQMERRAAEIIARAFLTADLEQDLIPRDEAVRTVDQHREQNDETWLRAVYASLKGLRSARSSGYSIEKAA